MCHDKDASLRLKIQMLVGTAFGFFVVVMFGVASADETPSSQIPAMPAELAPAVVVAAGADSINTNAVGRLSAEAGGLVERGTAFQLDDGRIVTVAHALIDARVANAGDVAFDPGAATIIREHDLALFEGEFRPEGLAIAPLPVAVGDSVAIGGVPESGRVEVLTGTVISRTSGVSYGIGRPDVYVLSATVDQGWSGGPVVNSDGEVVAVVVGVELRSGVTLAVPIEYLR